MLSRVVAATAAVAGANALNACVWLGNPDCPAGASFDCIDFPEGECVEALGIPGTTVYGKFDDNGDGTAAVGIYLNSADCSEGGITDEALLANNYNFADSSCTPAATIAGQTAYIQTTGDFGGEVAPEEDSTPENVEDETSTGDDVDPEDSSAEGDTEGSEDSSAEGETEDSEDSSAEGDTEDSEEDSEDSTPAQGTPEDSTPAQENSVVPEIVAPPAVGGDAAAVGGIDQVLALLASSGLPQNFIDVFRDVIGNDPIRVAAFLREFTADVDAVGLLGVFSELPDLSAGGDAEAGAGGLPTIPAFVVPFAQGLKANIRQTFTQNMLDALAASTVTNLLTNCGGFFALYGAQSIIGQEIAGTTFGEAVSGIIGVNPSEQRCAGEDITSLLPCTVGFIRSDVPTCSVDVCCGTADLVTGIPIVSQIIAEIITRVLTDLILPVLQSTVPYIRGGLASLANAATGEFNVLTNCGLVFYYADTLQIKGLQCKRKADLDKLQPCATTDDLIPDAPWGKCSAAECCGKGSVNSGIGRTITAFIAYEEAKIVEKLAQQLKIVLGAAVKTNVASGKYLITCRQWKNFLGGKCKNGQENVDHDYFCSTYSCMSFGVHKCSNSVCCHNASEGWVGAVLAIGITAGQLYEFAQIAAAANPFAPQWMVSCKKYNEQFGLKCKHGGKVDATMPCLLQTFEHKSSYYKCTEHNCCGQFSKKYTPAAAFEAALAAADEAADVLYAISKSNVGGLFTSGLYTDVQSATNCETWAAIPGWGYEAVANCTPISDLPYDVSCDNAAPMKNNFQPLAPCRSLTVDSMGNDLDESLPPCAQACYNRGQAKKLGAGTILAAQSWAYATQMIYLLTHMIADPVKAQAISQLLAAFKDVVTGNASAGKLDLAVLLSTLDPASLPDNIDDLLKGNITGNPVEVITGLLQFTPILPLNGLLMNCGVWSSTLDMNYFGRGTCPTGRPVDHDLPCWVSSINRMNITGANGDSSPSMGFGDMFYVNIMPNVGDCSPDYCCSCRTKAAYSNADTRLLGAAGASITELLIARVITPLVFKLMRMLDGPFSPLQSKVGFGSGQIYMPQTGYGAEAKLTDTIDIGSLIIGNQFCVSHSRFPDGSLPHTTNADAPVTFTNGTFGTNCEYWPGEM